MTGPLVKGTNRGPEVTDNYAQFIGQIDAASTNLRGRRQSLKRILDPIEVLFGQNELGLKLWEERRKKLDGLVVKETKSPDKVLALRELHEVALRMESMFLLRTQRIGEKQSAVKVSIDEINKSVLDLDRSKIKLESSRMLSRDRENLNRSVADLAGTPQGSNTAPADLGLRDDLTDARRAIVLAEALLELKGKRP